VVRTDDSLSMFETEEFEIETFAAIDNMANQLPAREEWGLVL